jgi:hypothetical protein
MPLHLYLLQFELAKKLQSLGYINLLILLGGMILVGLFFAFMTRSKALQNLKYNPDGNLEVGKPSFKDFVFGLKLFFSGKWTKPERDIIKQVIPAENAAETLSDDEKLDQYFQNAYNSMQRDDSGVGVTRKKINQLFTVRNTIEYYNNLKTGLHPRRHLRKETDLGCALYGINVVPTADGKKRKLEVSDSKGSGEIDDISVGGCSIQAKENARTGDMVKMEFQLAPGQNIQALGRIVDIHLESNRPIWHVKFLKISENSENKINSFVYGY